jgi:predicted nucleic-acid-binding Zn-ribbon protein
MNKKLQNFGVVIMKKATALENQKKKSRKSRDIEDEGNMEDSIPFDSCPKCGSKNLSKFDELSEGMGIDGMTDAQFSEYEAGNWGTVTCNDCGHTANYD